MYTSPIYHSDIFWHFCSKGRSEEEAYKILCKILREQAMYSPADLNGCHISSKNSNILAAANSRICFADIPFAFLRHHIGNYGNIGLGFNKQYLLSKGAQPLIYVAEVSKKTSFAESNAFTVLSDLDKEWSYLIAKAKPNLNNEELKKMQHLANRLAILKKYLKQFSILDKKSPYYEREWRIVNKFNFTLKNVELVVLPKRFVKRFIKKFPGIAYAITELIIS